MEITLYAEASELGWAPGHWPEEHNIDGIDFELNTVDENLTHTYVAKHDATKALVVFND